MTTPTLRPLSTGELLDRTFSLYRGHFALFVGIIAVTHLLVLTVQLVAVVLGPGPSTTFNLSSVFWPLLTLPVVLSVTAAAQGATVIAVSNVYLGRPITVTGALAHIQRRILGLAWIMIGMGLAIGAILGVGVVPVGVAVAVRSIGVGLLAAIWLMAAIVFAIVVMLRWTLVIPVAVLENRGLASSVSRSSVLTRGDLLRVFIVYVLLLVLVFVVTIVTNVPVGVIMFLSTVRGGDINAVYGWTQVMSAVASYLTQCLVGPLMTIAFALLYYDERVRKEAFDLELMMTAIDGQRSDIPSTSPVPGT
jgi:hypothetical protein